MASLWDTRDEVGCDDMRLFDEAGWYFAFWSWFDDFVFDVDGVGYPSDEGRYTKMLCLFYSSTLVY